MLVVDADPRARRVLSACARQRGDAIEFAASPTDAQRRLLASRYDSLCVDVESPTDDAIALLDGLRQGALAPIRIAMSASDDATVVSSTWRAGVEEFLHKPLEASTVNEALRRARCRRRRRSSTELESLPPALEHYARLVADQRAVEIIARRYRGECTASIARTLGISEVAAKKKLRRVYFKPLGTDRLLELERRARSWLAQHGHAE